ncbi:MAG: glycosyltransferase family 4 protein [Pseudoxanthomonas sp.]
MTGADDIADAADRPAQAGRIWLQLIEKEARCRLLEAQLAELQGSKSWRITAPLRALAARRRQWAPLPSARPALRAAATSGTAVSWQSLLVEAMKRRGMRAWLPMQEVAARYLVDVTELALEDLGAGVQRVTRSWLLELLLAPPQGLGIEPVRLDDRGDYVLARSFLAQFLGLRDGDLGADLAFQPHPADRFIGLDFCRDRAAQLEPALAKLRAVGVPISLVVPDMLPLQHPHWFPQGIAEAMQAWLGVLARQVDLAVCISSDCARNLREQLAARGLDARRLRMAIVPLGSDLPLAVAAEVVPPQRSGSTRLLMVGTLEPRKQHAQVLDAFDLMLAHGMDVELMIVGHPGWATEAVTGRIRRHREAGKRLHWLADADDSVLAAAYRSSDLLVMASLGEGFGLPIGEAARLGCGLLLRDIAVFREVAGDKAEYFSGTEATALVQAVAEWIQDRDRALPRAVEGRWSTWEESAALLKNETITS